MHRVRAYILLEHDATPMVRDTLVLYPYQLGRHVKRRGWENLLRNWR